MPELHLLLTPDLCRYAGETRLQRLLLIARTTRDETLASQAFDMAEQQMREDGNVKQYKEVFGYQHHLQQQTETETTQAAGAFVLLICTT